MSISNNHNGSGFISIQRQPQFTQKIVSSKSPPPPKKFFSKVSDYFFSKKDRSQQNTPLTEETSLSSSSKDIFKSLDIKVYSIKSTDEETLAEEVTETLADMEQAWKILDSAQRFAIAGQWPQAHNALLTIQNDFWRNAGYMNCAKLAANAVIDSQTMESADICFGFCDKISHPEQKANAIEVIETMLYQGKKVSLSEIDDTSFDSQLHPFKEAKSLALAGFWNAADQIISRMEHPFWRDRGYIMLAKMAAEAAIDPQKNSPACISRSFCHKISDEEKKTPTLEFIEEILPEEDPELLDVSSKSNILGEQSSLVLQRIFLQQSEVLSSRGNWREAHISISNIRCPKARDLGWSNLAKKAAKCNETEVAYQYYHEIKCQSIKRKTKVEIDRICLNSR